MPNPTKKVKTNPFLIDQFSGFFGLLLKQLFLALAIGSLVLGIVILVNSFNNPALPKILPSLSSAPSPWDKGKAEML